MYKAIALTNFNAQLTSGLLTLEDITNTKVLSRQLYSATELTNPKTPSQWL